MQRRVPILLVLIAGAFAGAPAAASAEQISGTVTAGGGVVPLAGICVSAQGGSGSGGATTDLDGTYAIDVPPASDYIVKFEDCANHLLQTEWYDNAVVRGDADPVVVEPGASATGIDASLDPDTTAPDTTITDGPQGAVGSGDVSFQFESSEEASTFECALDTATFTPCNTPAEYTGLADGSHTFQVRATDTTLHTDATPASRTFTVDSSDPETTIDTGPEGTVNTTTVTFTFSSSKPNSTFLCKIDDDSAKPCSSPQTYDDLVNGNHQFTVRAFDAVGNSDDTPATQFFTVDTGGEGDNVPPQTSIDTGPTGSIQSTSAQLTFHSSEPGSSFICRVDGANFESCSTPHDLSGLSQGTHTFQVIAIDAAGNADPSAAQRVFIVDTTEPETTIQSGPSGTTTDNDVSFGFTSNEGTARFQCALDAGAYVDCVSPHSYTSVPAGDHTFTVRSYDAAGNFDSTPATRTFTVPDDTSPPETSILTGPTGTQTSTSASFTFDSTENGSAFECSMDGGSFTSCSSPKSYTGLAVGDHTFEVVATDPFDNADPTPASRSFTIEAPPDTTPPNTTIGSGPTGTIGSSSTSFSFSSSEPDSTFECSLDSGAFALCSSPHALSGLADGSHTFSVRAIDSAGNRDASPATQAFTVQTQTTNPPNNAECNQAQATLDKAKSALDKAKAKLKKAKSKAAKKKAKAKVKSAKSKVKSASAQLASACN